MSLREICPSGSWCGLRSCARNRSGAKQLLHLDTPSLAPLSCSGQHTLRSHCQGLSIVSQRDCSPNSLSDNRERSPNLAPKGPTRPWLNTMTITNGPYSYRKPPRPWVKTVTSVSAPHLLYPFKSGCSGCLSLTCHYPRSQSTPRIQETGLCRRPPECGDLNHIANFSSGLGPG